MERITVDLSHVIRTGARDGVGINLNYLVDSDKNRPDAPPIAQVLGGMGMKRLRYPGGEKSDTHFWKLAGERVEQLNYNPDYRKLKLEDGLELLEFDKYVELCRECGAQPFVVTAYDNPLKYETKYNMKVTLEDCIENAVAWLTYANLTKRYGITYWEIGNENWHPESGMHPSRAGDDIRAIAEAMKAVDPSIKIGVSGMDHAGWWPVFLPKVSDVIDFLTVSEYACLNWGGYDHYVRHPEVNLLVQATEALRAIKDYADPASKDRLTVVITECNSKDFCRVPGGAWDSSNSLGHALVTFELFGQALLQPKIEFTMLWNTRWIKPEEPSIWDALNPANGLNPSGRAPAIWGQFLHDHMVASSSTAYIRSFASYDPRTGGMSVFLINKSYEEQPIELRIEGVEQPSAPSAVWRLEGTGPDDTAPIWYRAAEMTDVTAAVTLPPVSISVITAQS
ncbi:hypothetical protein [Paenibacillus gansuensis]|uniref:Alpha-L-arabinofuranosidase 1 catalytic domain-containing protein n=1 Tax=Paenibacillus gansuensis TaxID=306542 RepID=A0ABW5PDE8_9BACL